jgi:hypothetical protein
MRNLIFTAISLLFLSSQFVNAQKATYTIAPENPTALRYLAAQHFGYLGPVKTVYNMNFDKQGRLTEIKEEQEHTFIYEEDRIIVKKYDNVFHYILNAKNQITGWTIVGSSEKGIYVYDAVGNLIEAKSIFNDYTDHFTYTYDEDNRVISTTSWLEGSPDGVYLYEYYGDPENLVVTSMLKDDSSSTTRYYYKNGVLQDYIHDYNGASNMEDVVLDSYGNVVSYTDPTYEEEGENDGVSPFTYY